MESEPAVGPPTDPVVDSAHPVQGWGGAVANL